MTHKCRYLIAETDLFCRVLSNVVSESAFSHHTRFGSTSSNHFSNTFNQIRVTSQTFSAQDPCRMRMHDNLGLQIEEDRQKACFSPSNTFKIIVVTK
jgi:hypothetical protein